MSTEGVKGSGENHYYTHESPLNGEEIAIKSMAIRIIESNPIKHDFSEPSTDSPLVQKLKNFFNFAKHIGGAFNARTICTGASRHWDLDRLTKGKHTTLRGAGAENLELITHVTQPLARPHNLKIKKS